MRLFFFKWGEGQAKEKRFTDSKGVWLASYDRKKENDIAKISRSFFKGKVSWCPKELRWKLVIIPSGFWLSKAFLYNKKFPLAIKAGVRRPNEQECPFARQRKELSAAAITPETPFPRHCQQPPPKGIETKRNLSCQGTATTDPPKSSATMWLCSKEAVNNQGTKRLPALRPKKAQFTQIPQEKL